MCGASNHPDCIEYLQRVKKLLVMIILDDENFNIFSLQKRLYPRADVDIDPFEPDESTLINEAGKKPQKEAEHAGIYSIAGKLFR